ncbi:MAG: DNA translocase FtsK 4TM domain-containing protein, partial [Bacillota bacterium]
MNQFLKKFRQDVIAITFLGLGLFLALSLISYRPQDPSLNSIGQGLKALNYCGIVGSFLADAVYQMFGLAAWVMVASLVKIAYASFKGESLNLKNIRFVWALLLIVNVAALLSIYLPNTKLYQGQIYLGGLLGLTAAQALMPAFASVGVQVILWSFMAVLVVFYSEKTLQELAEIPQDFFGGVKKKKFTNGLGTFFSGMFVSDKTQKAKPKKDDKKEEPKKAFPLANKKFLGKDEEENEEDEDLEAILAADAEEEEEGEDESDEEEDDEDDVPALRLAQKRKVVMKAKPPRRIENWEMPKLGLLEDPPA